MKKSFFLSLAISIFGFGALIFSASAVEVTQTANLDGELIKGESYETVYYLAEDGKRYVFPNSKTYFSWFDDFSTVREVADEELFSYPLGGNVRYKPGSLLVKITTDPKVYAVSKNGELRWVKSEEVAKALYGQHWNKLIDDLPDSFFTNYSIGMEIKDGNDYDPTEAEEEFPTISHNRGFKTKEKAQKVIDAVEKKCNRLEEAVNKLQKRAEKYGMEIPGVGDDFVTQCVDKNMSKKDTKVKVCHVSEEGRYKTLEVASPAALKMYLSERATLGACDKETRGEDEEENEEDENEDEENEDEENEDEECEEGDDSSEECLALEAAKAAVVSTSAALLVAEELVSTTATTLLAAEELASSTALALEEAEAATSTPQAELDELATEAEEAADALEIARTEAREAAEALEVARTEAEEAADALEELED